MAELSLKEIVKKEYLKSAIDASYCFGKYCNIVAIGKGKVKFKLYDFQKDVLSQFQTHKYNIVLKARQMGISTLIAAYALWCMIFKNDFKVIVIATNQATARNLVKKIQLMYEGLPSWLKPAIKENNKLGMSFTNGSEIRALSSAGSAARSEAASLLIIDEAAFIENFKEVWASAKPTLATGGDCLILSTPNGVGNQFHTLWEQAELGEKEEGIEKFNAISLKWDLHPDRTEAFRRQQDIELGPALAAQEYDCDFMTSGTGLIEGVILKWYRDNQAKEPVERRGPNEELWIWKYPNYNKTYIVAADVARGDGADFSAFVIMEAESCDIVATYRNKVETRDFGAQLVSISIEYNSALLVIDNKSIGWDVVQEALNRNYENIYYSYRQDPYLDENIHLRKAVDLRDKKDMVPGFTTTLKTRPVMISKVQSYFTEKQISISCLRSLNELATFVWLNGKVQAMNGKNDDLCMSLAMALYVRDTALKLRSQGIEIAKKSILGVHKSMMKSSRTGHSSWEMRTGRDKDSLTWLL